MQNCDSAKFIFYIFYRSFPNIFPSLLNTTYIYIQKKKSAKFIFYRFYRSFPSIFPSLLNTTYIYTKKKKREGMKSGEEATRQGNNQKGIKRGQIKFNKK
jgi:hypothetical protein